MAKIKIRRSGQTIRVLLKYSFWETIDIRKYTYVVSKGDYGLLKIENIKGLTIFFEPFVGKPLKEFLTLGLSRNDVVRLVEQILLVLLEIDKIGLSRNSLVMDLDNIYLDMDTKEVRMICSCADLDRKEQGLLELLKEVLNAYMAEKAIDLDFKREFMEFLDKLGTGDIYRIEDYLASGKRKIVLDVRKSYYTRLYRKLSEDQQELSRISLMKEKIDQEKLREQSDEMTDCHNEDDQPTGYMNDSDDNEPTGFADREDVLTGFAGSADDDDDDDDEPTGFYEEEIKAESDDLESAGFDIATKVSGSARRSMGDIQTNLAKLNRKSTSETIYINKALFRLGRDESGVDYCLEDNKKISRVHADLIFKNGQWYIIDLKSKNGTFVNNRILQANVETMLHDGDVIRLNNEEFVFSQKS